MATENVRKQMGLVQVLTEEPPAPSSSILRASDGSVSEEKDLAATNAFIAQAEPEGQAGTKTQESPTI